MLKMLFPSYLWNVSERMIEILANDSLSIGLFLGLGADEKAPDHSTLTLFKNRLTQNAGLKAYDPKIAIEIQVGFATVHVMARRVIPRLSLRGT